MENAKKYRHQYRHYSRCVKGSPAHTHYHKRRILIAKNIAKTLGQTEPLQGAVADYFFACWYDINHEGKSLLEYVADHLPKHIITQFFAHINTGRPMLAVSVLATRYSVLVLPSMNVPKEKLYVGKDDATGLSYTVSQALIRAKDAGDSELFHRLQTEYIEHCLACQDKMGFMKTWFSLSKLGFELDDNWLKCQQQLQNNNDKGANNS